MSVKFKSEANDKEAEKLQNDNVGDGKNIEVHNSKSNVRYVRFVHTNGKHTSLNYSYLIASEFDPEESTIELIFSTHVVKIKGSNLEQLFQSIEKQEPKKISCASERYKSLEGQDACRISNITIAKSKD